MPALFRHLLQQRLVDPGDDAYPCRRANRIAAIGGTMGAWGQYMLGAGAKEGGAHGQASRQGFGSGNDIRLHTGMMHIGKVFSRAAVAALDLVCDQENILFPAQLGDRLDVIVRQGLHTAFSLDHFHHDGAYAPLLHLLLDGGNVIGRHVDKAL